MPPHGSAKKKKKGRDGTGKKKSRAGGARDHGRASSGVGGGSSLENLIDSGNEHLAMDRVEEGLNDLRKACALVPDSADAWDAYGMALAEFGAPDDAIKVLKRAAQLSPNIGYEKVSFFFISVWAIVMTCFFYSKFMYLGQLLDDGEAAATCTRQGLALIEHQAAHGDEDAHDRMCGACCALAEQLMGTADEVEAVADECDSLLMRAREADGRSAEPLQCLASLRVLQGRSDEALEALRQSMAIWRHGRKGGASKGDDEDDGDDDDEDDDKADEFLGEYEVSFEFRFECAKLLLELDEKTDAAINVLEELLEERDDVADVWHLLALANHGCCEFDRALELLVRFFCIYVWAIRVTDDSCFVYHRSERRSCMNDRAGWTRVREWTWVSSGVRSRRARSRGPETE